MSNTSNNSKELYSTTTLSTSGSSPTHSNNNSIMSSTDPNNNMDEEKANFEVVDNGVKQSVNFSHQPHLVRRGLTEVSAMFDRNGKGYLDDTERALRRMDSQDKGFLGIDKVCVIFESLQAEQERSSELLEALREESKKSMNLKMGVIALSCFTLLLALANVGTSFAVAQLVKDTETAHGDLVVVDGGQRVATTSKLVSFQMDSLDEDRRRRLQADTTLMCETLSGRRMDGTGSDKDCALQGVIKLDQAEALHSVLGSVDYVNLVCNGERSSISGGRRLHGTPGLLSMGPDYEVKLFPDGSNTNAKYAAVQEVSVPAVEGNLELGIVGQDERQCDANFQMAMFCPTALGADGKQQDCMVFTAYKPTIECPTNPVICGPKPDTSQGTLIN